MIVLRSNAGALAASLRDFAQRFPRVTQKRLDLWARGTSNVLRQRAATVVKSGISGRCIRHGGRLVALLRSRHQVGLFQEQGTGLHGPRHKLIVSKGGYYVDPVHATYRRRRMLRIPVSKGFVASGAGGGVSFRQKRGFIFRPWSRGMKAKPWFVPTIRQRAPVLSTELIRDYHAELDRLSAALPR